MPRTLPAIINLVPNPSAEVDTTGMTSSRNTAGTAVLTRSNEWEWAGLYTYKLAVTVAGPTAMQISTINSTSSPYRIQCTPGKTYSARAAIRTPNNAMGYRIWFYWYDAAGASLGQGNAGLIALTANTDTIGKTESMDAPAGASYLVMQVQLRRIDGTAMAVGETLYADAWQVTETDTAPAYVDGSMGTNHRWYGTPHLSASERKAIPLQQTRANRGRTLVAARLYRSNFKGQLLEELPGVLEGKTVTNVHNLIKTYLTLRTSQELDLEPYVDIITPVLTLTDAEGIERDSQLGVFLTLPPKQSHGYSFSTAQVEGRDLTQILANNYYGATYNIVAGSTVTARVNGIINQHGLNYNVPGSPAVTSKAMSFAPDVSYLDICNALLNSIGYYTLWADRSGAITSRPYFELGTATPALQLFSGEGGNVVGTIEQEGVYDTVANKIIVYKENTQGAPIVATYINDDPLSPSSTVNQNGRIIPRIIKDSNILDQTTANEIARHAAEEGASFTNKLKVITKALPDRELHEVYDLAIYNKAGKPIGFGLWWCDGTEIGFTPKSVQQIHNLKRLELYGRLQ